MFILDSHCDTPSQIRRLRDLRLDNSRGQVDFPKMKRGGVDAAFFAIYTPASFSSDMATVHALDLIAGVYDTLDLSRDSAAIALTPGDALLNKDKGLISVFLGMENGSPIQMSLSLLRQFYRLGIRYMTLCHSSSNNICDSCASEIPYWNGLSPFGKEVVGQMNELGMIIDVSHISDASFFDVMKYSEAPVVATHSCCRALAQHPRNLTDEMLRAIADKGGVAQINFYPVFLDNGFAVTLEESGISGKGEEIEAEFIADPANPQKRAAWDAVYDELNSLPRPSYKRIVDHIDHAVNVAGIEHVGIGSDFDGIAVTPEGLDDISHIGIIFDEMKSRGYSWDDIEKVAGKNFLRTMSDVQSLTKML